LNKTSHGASEARRTISIFAQEKNLRSTQLPATKAPTHHENGSGEGTEGAFGPTRWGSGLADRAG
jgi:hypothetical protein